jgi:3-deoxy-7-phosphoheptulonate synthase
MIVVMKQGATEAQISHVAERIKELGLTPHLSRGQFRTIIGAIGEEGAANQELLRQIDGVEQVLQIMKPYKLCSREFHAEDTVIEVKGIRIGGNYCAVIGGPCTIENLDMLEKIARHVRQAGARILRGGAFKPRTSPYSFQGLGKQGLQMLADVGQTLGMATITEVMDPRDVDLVARYADILQIGARNMQNYNLLREVGQTHKPVMLKRGMAAPFKEWLMSAEYIFSGGNHQVILCERGIRSFETETRFTMDVSCVPLARLDSHLPVYVDPSHAAGRRDLIESMALAAIAAGAHGVMVEVHHCPEQAVCDGPQALLPEQFASLMARVRQIASVVGKTVE